MSNTQKQDKKKKEFVKLLKSRGVANIFQFSEMSGIANSNIYPHFRDEYQMSFERALIYANTLGVPIDDIFRIFRPDDMKSNDKAIKKFKLPVD